MQKFFVSLVFVVNALTIYGQNKISILEVGNGFQIPVEISNDGVSEDIYVVEKAGRIFRVDKAGVKSLLADIRNRVNSSANERGLLGLAFHPHFEENGYFFVNYTRGDGATVISRFELLEGEQMVNPGSEKIVLTIPQPFNNHNGGSIKFGMDGYLYIGMGDGGSGGDPGNRAQNPTLLLGKMLRIDIDSEDAYSIPASNPFASENDTLPEIFLLGLRNPWKFSFDKITGDMVIADVGQKEWEELNFIPSGQAGKNLGWRCYEGNAPYNLQACLDPTGYTFPFHTYANNQTEDGCSITGGYVYRGSGMEYFYGKYIYGDFCSGNLWAIHQDECGTWHNETIYKMNPQELSSFGEDIHGELYAANLGSGKIYHLKSVCELQADFTTIPASCQTSEDGAIEIIVSGAPNYQIIFSGPSENLQSCAPGMYQITISDDRGCSVQACQQVGIEEVAPLEIGESQLMVCMGSESTLDLLNVQGLDSVAIYLNGEFLAFTHEAIPVTEEGTYTFIGFVNSCPKLINGHIELLFYPEIVLEEIMVSDSTIVIEGDYMKYLVYKNGVLFESNDTGIFILPDAESSNYSLQVQSEYGCYSNIVDIIYNSLSEIDWFRSVEISPNPVSRILEIKFNAEALQLNLQAKIFDQFGRKINDRSSVPGASNILQYDLGNQLPGTYYVKLTSNLQQICIPIVKI